ncbi:LexA-binding, inner membrane-associated putative hydrolase [Desulfobotulus alkaliphilus]|uniref:LexA-binding, inner membrane-associated putative hydrolase n=1 Tax=Desulfobotulus alkaliphilus TaxID=622671 RepID=A0A562RQ47_9BACT|nr:metal-dependent hydrolase [Desulfobotulus alkaliphilus]TWI71138.1 LexA-binding, inner membrane-associated putative hydrolase [Desulfobotulus alkaliphilus]
MPGYKAHLGFGSTLGILCLAGLFFWELYRPPLETMAILMGLCLIGSLTPDVDTDSKGQNLVYSLLILFDLFLIFKGEYKWAAILGFCAMLPAIGHHRGWTHSWWAMLVIPLPILAAPVYLFHQPWQQVLPYYLAFVLGFFSHLLLDRRFF